MDTLTPHFQRDARSYVSTGHLPEPDLIQKLVSDAHEHALKIGPLIMALLALATIVPAGNLPSYRPGEIPDDKQQAKRT
jgi:hypothetical protein